MAPDFEDDRFGTVCEFAGFYFKKTEPFWEGLFFLVSVVVL